MKIELDQITVPLRVTAYDDTSITIAGTKYDASIIIGIESIIENSLPAVVQDLETSHLEQVISMQPEIILIGTGQQIAHPSDHVTQLLFESRIGWK